MGRKGQNFNFPPLYSKTSKTLHIYIYIFFFFFCFLGPYEGRVRSVVRVRRVSQLLSLLDLLTLSQWARMPHDTPPSESLCAKGKMLQGVFSRSAGNVCLSWYTVHVSDAFLCTTRPAACASTKLLTWADGLMQSMLFPSVVCPRIFTLLS